MVRHFRQRMPLTLAAASRLLTAEGVTMAVVVLATGMISEEMPDGCRDLRACWATWLRCPSMACLTASAPLAASCTLITLPIISSSSHRPASSLPCCSRFCAALRTAATLAYCLMPRCRVENRDTIRRQKCKRALECVLQARQNSAIHVCSASAPSAPARQQTPSRWPAECLL